MTCTQAQAKFIEDLQSNGAPIPEHPHFDRPADSMFHSVYAADVYIKENLQYRYKKIYEAPFAISDHANAGPAAHNVPNH